MADVPLYQQNFQDGTPVFHTDSVFDRPGGDSADPNYPEISYAEGLIINGSGHADSGHGYNYSANALGLGEYFSFVNDLPGGPLLVSEGYFQVRYKPNATSIALNADLIFIYRDNGDFLSVDRIAGTNILHFEGWDSTASQHLDEDISWTPVADTEYLIRLEWQVGDSGYSRLKVNGTTLHENPTFGPTFDGAGGDQVKSIQLGGFALFGEFWEIELGTFTTEKQVWIFGADGDVSSHRTAAWFLGGSGDHTVGTGDGPIDEPGTFYIDGNLIVTGTAALEGGGVDISALLDGLGT